MARILVIDDDAALLAVIRGLLADDGHEVVLSESVQPSPYVEKVAPDLIILDYFFDGEPEGWELLQRLKMKHVTAHIPIVVCTGATEALHRMERSFFRQGIEVVLKPFTVEELQQAVNGMLNHGAQRALGATTAPHR